MIRTTIAASVLLLCSSAYAADNPALKKCMDSANTTADMVNCNARQTKVQDDRLNRAYKTALATGAQSVVMNLGALEQFFAALG